MTDTTTCMRCAKVHHGAQSEIWALGWAVPLDVTHPNGKRGFMCGDCYALLMELRRRLARHCERELYLFMDGASS